MPFPSSTRANPFLLSSATTPPPNALFIPCEQSLLLLHSADNHIPSHRHLHYPFFFLKLHRRFIQLQPPKNNPFSRRRSDRPPPSPAVVASSSSTEQSRCQRPPLLWLHHRSLPQQHRLYPSPFVSSTSPSSSKRLSTGHQSSRQSSLILRECINVSPLLLPPKPLPQRSPKPGEIPSPSLHFPQRRSSAPPPAGYPFFRPPHQLQSPVILSSSGLQPPHLRRLVPSKLANG